MKRILVVIFLLQAIVLYSQTAVLDAKSKSWTEYVDVQVGESDYERHAIPCLASFQPSITPAVRINGTIAFFRSGATLTCNWEWLNVSSKWFDAFLVDSANNSNMILKSNNTQGPNPGSYSQLLYQSYTLKVKLMHSEGSLWWFHYVEEDSTTEYSLIVDDKGPDIPPVDPIKWTGPNMTISFQCTDSGVGVSSISCSTNSRYVDGAIRGVESPTVTNNGGGNYSFIATSVGDYYITAIDALGNPSYRTITINDGTPPVLTLNKDSTQITEDGITYSQLATGGKAEFQITGTESYTAGDSGFSDFSYDSWIITSAPSSITQATNQPVTGNPASFPPVVRNDGLQSGYYYWAITGKDHAGNPSIIRVKQLLLLQDPSFEKTFPDKPNGWYTTLPFTVKAKDAIERKNDTDNIIHLYYSNDTRTNSDQAKSWTDAGNTTNFTFSEGTTPWAFKAVDEAGYSCYYPEGDGTAPLSCKVDVTKPTLSTKATTDYPACWLDSSQPLYIKSSSQLSPIIISDATSGVVSLSYKIDDANTSTALWTSATALINEGKEVPFAIPDNVTGLHTYSFTLTDAAGNPKTKSVQVLLDTTAIQDTQIKLGLTDVNVTPPLQKSDFPDPGNFSDLKLIVNQQGLGEAQPYSYSWKLDNGSTSTGSFGNPSDGCCTASLISGPLAEGLHTVSVTVTDQAGNTTTKDFQFTVDRTPPPIVTKWVNIPADANHFTVTPTPESNIVIYQTDSTHSVTAGAVCLWDNGSKLDSNGNPVTGTFSLANGSGIIYLAAIDKAGNKAEATYTILRPDEPAAPALSKQVKDDYSGFSVVVSDAVKPSFSSSGVTYSLSYQGVGVTDAAGNTVVENAQTITAAANGTGYSWSSALDVLGSSGGAKAYEAGHLGRLKAWAVLSPPETVGNNVIALPKTGAPFVYAIPNSAPGFRSAVTWPEYIGANTPVTIPLADDPDGHAVHYRYKVVSGGQTSTYGGDEAGLPSETGWSSHLLSGGTVTLEAWAGEGSPWVREVTAGNTHEYGGADIDLVNPEASVGTPWFEQPIWTRAAAFTVRASDSGPSGLGSVSGDLAPCTDDGELEAGSSREHYPMTLSGFTAGDKTATLTASLSETLDGMYRLTLTVIDQAGNQYQHTRLARFDHRKPNVTGITVTRPYDTEQKRYLADKTGTITATLAASDSRSGLGQWGYQTEGGRWVWNPWYGEAVSCTPDWSLGATAAVRYAVRDKVGNESDPTDWISAHYEASPPEFDLTVSGLTGTQSSFLGNLGDLQASVAPADAGAKWTLVRSNEDGSETISAAKDTWEAVRQDGSLWADGARYRIRATVTNENGISGSKESASFVLDRTAPSAVTVAAAPPNEQGRQAYYQNEPFIVTWAGGADNESPVTRTVRLYQMKDGNPIELNAVILGTGEAQARITWGTTTIDWPSGGFYIEGIVVNGAGAVVRSASVPVAVNGQGLSVFVAAYNGGTGLLAISWSAGTITGVAEYRYRLWAKGAGDTPLGGETRTNGDSALIDIGPFNLADGTAIYATVSGYDGDGTLVAQGASTVSVVDKGLPSIVWKEVPVAVTSSRVWARFQTTGSASGVASSRWLIEKKHSEADWAVVPYTSGTNWRPAAGALASEVSADLTGVVAAGDQVRITVLSENAVGRASQIATGSIIVDDTAPPIPVVVDQGQVINQIKQALTFNWKMSEGDAESGTAEYYYRWFYIGEPSENESWTKASKDTLQVEVDLRSAGAAVNGKNVIFAVKAVNQAGLASIGYSDGIILDSMAPYVNEMKVFSNSGKSVELAGYVKNGDIEGKSVYLSVEAVDAQSWVGGGTTQAYRWNDAERAWVAEGTLQSISGVEGVYTLTGNGAGFTVGSRWRFEGSVFDAAGNVSAKAVSGGFFVEGTVPSVTGLRGALDSKRINLSWNVSDAASTRWISHYTVTARWGNNSSPPILTTTRSSSFIWGEGGLGLSDGDTVQFTVTAVSYTNESINSQKTADYQTTMTIDGAAPELDDANVVVPVTKGATHWYDRLEGHLAYKLNRGVSSIQWSAVTVPGELPLVDWQEKRWVNQWDFEKLFSAITSDGLASWNGMQIRLRFRAANTMGIWSDPSAIRAITVDTTPPETASFSRNTAYSNETNAVSGFTVNLQDEQSGILGFMTMLVPTAQVSGASTPASYVWPDGATYNTVDDHSPSVKTAVSVSVPLAAPNEGSFTPLLRVRNGTGHWSVFAGSPITMDRTSPVATNVQWLDAVPQTLLINGESKTVLVTNGPSQGFAMTADESVKYTVTGSWVATQVLPTTGYSASVTGSLPFGANADGALYPVTITLEDQAGNQSVFDTILRYNRAPVVTIKESAMTVRPGVSVRLEDMVSVTDEEEGRAGDYALRYQWVPGNGGVSQGWTGGSTLQDVFGTGAGHSTIYTQSSPTAQTSSYTGTIVVTDRYDKSTTVSLPITVENTREGTLAVDEYWSGPFEVRGWVVVPAGKTLTLSGAAVTVNASLDGEIMDGGILVEQGGTLSLSGPTAMDQSSVTSRFPGILWKGIRARGVVTGAWLDLSSAERALTLEPTGSIDLRYSTLTGNLIGLHLLGGSLDWNGGQIKGNQEYGIKEDGAGIFNMQNTDFISNGVNYYKRGVTRLTIDELNAQAGNGGNREVR